MNYYNEICQGCGRKISEGEDIVVCPECGTPQHRECYEKENKCVNEHLHAENYEWKPKHSAEPDVKPTVHAHSHRVCSFCGYKNDDEATYCENCGQPFEIFGKPLFYTPEGKIDESENYIYKPPFDVEGKKDDRQEPTEKAEDTDTYFPENEFSNSSTGDTAQQGSPDGENSGFDAVYGAFYDDGETGGISNHDLGAFVRVNFNSYTRKFSKIENKKPTFNFAAFIFGHIWYFYRKMYKAGAVFLTLTVCLATLFLPSLNEAYDGLSATMSSLQEQIQQLQNGDTTVDEDAILDEMEKATEEYMPVITAFIASNLALQLVAALLADRLYKKKCTKTINEINTVHAGDDRSRLGEFMRKGGTSYTLAISAYFLQSILTTILQGVIF